MNSTERAIRAIKAEALRDAANARYAVEITDAGGQPGEVLLRHVCGEDAEWLTERARLIESGENP